MDQIINEIQHKTKNIFISNGVTFAAVFGSTAKHINTDKSDIDILFDYDHSMSSTPFVKIIF